MTRKLDDSYVRQLFSELTDYYKFVEVESGIELEDVKKYDYTDIYHRMEFQMKIFNFDNIVNGCFTIFQEFNTIVLIIRFNRYLLLKDVCLKNDFHIFIDRLEEDYKVSVIEQGSLIKICINKRMKI